MRFRKVAAASLVAGGLLLVSACGSDSSGGGDKIEGVQKSSPSQGGSDAGAGSGKGPDLSLPKDLKVDFEWDRPQAKKEAAAVTNAEKFVLAMRHGVTAQKVNDPAYPVYSVGPAKNYARGVIKQYVDDDWTLTGKDRYYRLGTEPRPGRDAVMVTFCRDQGSLEGKKVTTKKVEHSEPSREDFQKFTVSMERSSDTNNQWKAKHAEVMGESTECQGA